MDPRTNDFSINFNWTKSLGDSFSAPPTKVTSTYDSYEKRDSFTIRNCTVRNHTSSSMGSVRAVGCLLKSVDGRDGVTLENCAASRSVSSSMGKVNWNGWNGDKTGSPCITGRDGVVISNISAKDVTSSMGKVKVNNGEAGKVSGRDGVLVLNASVKKAYTSMGKLFGKDCDIESISARDGIELINSKSSNAKSSMGKLKAENCTIEGMSARDGIKIKNCSGSKVTSEMGEIVAFSNSADSKIFDLLQARDGVKLVGVSSKKVSSSMGPVNCNEGVFEVIQSSGSSSLKRSKIKHLELSIEEGKDITIDLTDSVVNSVAVKVKNAVSSCSEFSGSDFVGSDVVIGYGGFSSKSIIGNRIEWTQDGSILKASPSSFSVEGSLLGAFVADIKNRCRFGTIGTINGIPAKLTSSGIVFQEIRSSSSPKEIATKVSIIGGEIIGDIRSSELVKIDTSKTEFLGKIVSV